MDKENKASFLAECIQRIIRELIVDSLDADEQGKIKISVELDNVSDKTDEMVIKLLVSGPGIHQKKANNKTQKGLATAKQFVENMGGKFVEMPLDQGTEFTCTIPLPGAVAQADARILLVEDDVLTMQVTNALLKNSVSTVDIVQDGLSAVEHSKKNTYDLIFMDVELPKIDGKEAVRRIREWESLVGGRHTPIIALTVHTDVENKQACIDAGVDAVLSKPISVKTAREVLQAFVPKLAKSSFPDSAAKVQTTANFVEKELKSSQQIIDLEAGINIVENEQTAKELLKILVTSAVPQILESLQMAYVQKDWQAIGEIVHRFYGGICYCGAPRLKLAVFNLKKYIESGQTALQENFYQQLLDEITSLREEYHSQSAQW